MIGSVWNNDTRSASDRCRLITCLGVIVVESTRAARMLAATVAKSTGTFMTLRQWAFHFHAERGAQCSPLAAISLLTVGTGSRTRL